MRECASCGRDLPRSSYTPNQYSKGFGILRCAGCVHGRHFDTPTAAQYNSGRYNNSSRSSILCDELENPFAEGAFRYVAKGTYTSGDRRGQECVVKWFKTGGVFEADYFTLDIKAVDKALEIVNKFNELNIVNMPIRVNVPAVWTFDDDGNDEWSGQKHLCEPFIEDYQKFNNNSGWNDDSDSWGEVM